MELRKAVFSGKSDDELMRFCIVSKDNDYKRFDWDSGKFYTERLDIKGADVSELKTFFKDTLLNNGYTIESLEKNLGVFVRTYGDECFDMETPFGMEMIRIIRKKNLKFQPTIEELEPKPIEKKDKIYSPLSTKNLIL